MELRKLMLENFLCHEELELEFGKVTLLAGENGTGKSAVQGALEWLLTGSCRNLDARGSRNAELVRKGADAMSVHMVGEGGIVASRSYSDGKSSLEVAGMPSMAKMAQCEERLWEELGIKKITAEQARRILRSALTAGEMASWKAESWSEVLSLLAPGDAAAVMKDLSEELQSSEARNLSEEGADKLRKIVTEVYNMMVPSVESQGRARIVRALEDGFTELRKHRKKELRDLRARNALPVDENPLLTLPEKEFAERLAQAYKDQKDAETQVRQFTGVVERLEGASNAYQGAEERIKELEAERRTAEGEMIGKCTLEEFQESERMLEELRGKTKHAVHRVGYEQITWVLEHVKELSKTSTGKMESARGPLVPEGSEAEELEFTQAANSHVQVTLSYQALQELEKKVQEINRRIADLRKVRQGEEPEDPAAYREALDKWLKNRAVANEQVSLLTQADAVRRERARASTEVVQKAELDVQILEVLVAASRSERVRAGENLSVEDRLVELITTGVEATLGVEFDVDAERRLFVDGRSWDLLSESERVRFGVALQASISQILGFPWLIVDRVEVLVGPSRPKFFAWIHSLTKSFDRIILIGAFSEKPQALPRGWGGYWFGGGECRVSSL